MAEESTLAVARRSALGKRVKQLRRQGRIPGNIFGRPEGSMPIEIDAHSLELFLHHHPATRLISMPIAGHNGPTEHVLMRHVQHEPRTGHILHIDFFHVAMNEPIAARIPLRFVGEAPAVKMQEGILLHLIDTVEVEALPRDLPEALTVSLEGLTQVDTALYVRDIPVPSNVKVLSAPEEVVVKISPLRGVVAEEGKSTAAQPEPTRAGAAPTTEER